MYYMKLYEPKEDSGDTIDLNHSNKLVYYCRKCGDTDENIGNKIENLIVSTTNIKKNEQKFHHIINKYTKLDPTLPRIYNIDCPNSGCSSNSTDETVKTENEIIYMRYDDKNMKYVYICSNCDTIWKN